MFGQWLVPKGHRESSPEFQRRETVLDGPSPEGTVEWIGWESDVFEIEVQPSLRDSSAWPCEPSVKTLGYCRESLRDNAFFPNREEKSAKGIQTYTPFTVELTKLAHLGGVVMDTHGSPLKDVKVRASSVMAMDERGYRQPSSQQAVTDEAGRFELAKLPGGFLQLRASAPGARATVKVVYE